MKIKVTVKFRDIVGAPADGSWTHFCEKHLYHNDCIVVGHVNGDDEVDISLEDAISYGLVNPRDFQFKSPYALSIGEVVEYYGEACMVTAKQGERAFLTKIEPNMLPEVSRPDKADSIEPEDVVGLMVSGNLKFLGRVDIEKFL
jgi:hypothetical protein